MQSFEEFINEAVINTDLWHGTNTGKDNVNIASFRKGVSSRLSGGHGQGEGFYVFTSQVTARNHALNLVNKDANVVSKADTGGHPMVVKVVAALDPDNWDIDYEMNSAAVIKFVATHFDEFQKFTGELDIEGTKYSLNKKFNDESFTMNMKRPGSPLAGRKGFNASGGEGNINHGKIVSAIMKKLKAHDPKMDRAFKVSFFSDLKPGMALKYVGAKTLPVKAMEIYRDGKWGPV